MNKKTRMFSVIIILAAGSACSFHASKQNPDKAAVKAVEFAEAAFVKRDVDKAYSLLDPEFQAYAPKEKFAGVLAAINSPTSPTTVTANEFEPIHGQEGINIFMMGENTSEKFYYRLAMKGTEERGYKIAGVFRGQEQYKPSESRQVLQVKRSTGHLGIPQNPFP